MTKTEEDLKAVGENVEQIFKGFIDNIGQELDKLEEPLRNIGKEAEKAVDQLLKEVEAEDASKELEQELEKIKPEVEQLKKELKQAWETIKEKEGN